MIHVVQYMTKTDGYHCTYRKTPRGMSNLNESIRNGTFDFSQVKPKEHHLLEVYSDSDWAGQKTVVAAQVQELCFWILN